MAVIAIFQNTHLIFNPVAGQIRKHPERLQRAVATLEGEGMRVQPHPTAAPLDATRLARELAGQAAELIIVAGGDGTVNEAVNGLAGASTPLAVLPAGTANVLCQELGLGSNMERVARRIPSLVATPVRVGIVETPDGAGRRFLCMVGFGLDAAVVERVDPELKRRTGKFAYWVATMALLGHRLPEFDVAAHGATTRCSMLVASRVRNYGGDLSIATTASLRRDDFELVGFRGAHTLPYIAYFGGVAVRAHKLLPGVTTRAATDIDIRPVPGQRVFLQVDGELAGQLPARVRIAPEPLQLLMPANYR